MDSSGSALGALLLAAAAAQQVNPAVTEIVYWTAIAQVIVDYIQANASVTFPVVSTVIAPPGTSGGPCSGTLVAGNVL